MAKFTDCDAWFEMWHDDKQCIIDTMVHNMQADLEAGYDYFGNSIKQQREEIDAYKADFDNQMSKFWTMTHEDVEKWCFYDLVRRGAIE